MTYDAIVIGAGVMGLATAVELGKRGQKVLVLDQFGIPNTLGSSHGETRVIRTAYFEHPDYVPLAQRAWQRWLEDCEDAPGSPLIWDDRGGMYLGRPDSALISGSIAAARKFNLDHEVASPDVVRKEFPQVSIPDDYAVFFERQCGVLLAEQCIRHLIRLAKRGTVDLRANHRVTSWSATAWSVSVATDQGTFEAGRLVICAGPWASRVLDRLSVPLTVTRQVVGHTAPANPKPFTIDQMPVVCMEAPNGDFFYVIPGCPPNGAYGEWLKSAKHNHGKAIDPDAVDRSTSPEDAESFLSGLRQFLPCAAGLVMAMDVCLYTNTPDGHFVIDKHPNHDNVVFACGFSGHGFKFAPVIGEALADLALNGKTDLPIGFLSASRFSR